LASACGDKVDVKEAPPNDDLREVVWAKDGLANKLDDNLTITRIVVSRTTDRAFRQSAAAKGDSRAQYTVEFWGRYDNTSRGDSRVDQPTSVERHGSIGGLLSDASGNLYVDGMEPGTVLDNPALATAGGEVQRAIDHWTISPTTALISKFDWVKLVQNTVTANKAVSTTYDAVDLGEAFQIGNAVDGKHKLVAPLGGIDNSFLKFDGNYATASNDSIYSLNTGYTAYTAPVACVITAFDDKTAGTQTAVTAVKPLTAKLTLGRNLIDQDGIVNSSATDKAGATGQQDLVVSWNVQYHMAGFNWQTGHLSWYRTTAAPAWQNRELPSVDQSVTAAAPSGIEAAILECNALAGVNDKWSLVARDTSGSATSAAFNAAQASHCAGLKKDTAHAKWPLASFNNTLSSPKYDCTAAFAPLITGGTAIAAHGDWQVSGTALKHTGRVTTGAAGGAGELLDVETTDIGEVAL
jgi:hypothetical protein